MSHSTLCNPATCPNFVDCSVCLPLRSEVKPLVLGGVEQDGVRRCTVCKTFYFCERLTEREREYFRGAVVTHVVSDVSESESESEDVSETLGSEDTYSDLESWDSD